MADFRKILVLAGLVLMLALTASAQQQPLTCTANAAVPPTVRSEGMTELVGDIVLDCTGGVPTAAGTTVANVVNFTIFLNTNVTSRIENTTTNLSEAVLLVDEPGSGAPGSVGTFATCPTGTVLGRCDIVGTGGASTPYTGTSTTTGSGSSAVTTYKPNVFRGIVSGNQVTFLGVPVDPPGTTGNHRIFRFTNIRANASGISAGASGTPGSIQALISASGSTSLPITSPTQVVGFVQQGLDFFWRNRSDFTSNRNTSTDIDFAQCQSLSRTTTTNSFVVQFRERFATAFKARGGIGQNVPGQIYNNESGFTVSTVVDASGRVLGYADAGTRLKAVFTNIPAGINVYAALSNYAASGNALLNSARLILNAGTAAVEAPASFTDFTGITGGVGGTLNNQGFQLPVVNGTATAVWEINSANALSSDDYNFPIWFNYSAAQAQNSPPPGTATLAGSFAPTPGDLGVSTSTAASTSASLAIPRFAESTSSRAALIIFLCRTTLLFPFVTNQAGFDTGLAIANTSLDTGVFTANTTAQTGACTLFAFGDNAPASIATGSIAAGKVYVNLASAVMPNFQGYVMASCQFQFAHGFAFISDLGARNLAMGYLALVIPEQGADTRSASAPGGENLNN